MPTLQQVLDHFLRIERASVTTANYRRFLQPFVAAIGPGRSVELVTHDDIIDYFDRYRRERGVRPSTAAQYAAITRGFFSWCVTAGHIAQSPAANFRVRKPGRSPGSRAIPPDDLAALVDAARHHVRDYAFILFMIDTGCRVGGAATLTLDHLDLDAGTAILLEKGARWHTVYYGPETAEALRAWLRKRPQSAHGHVWTSTGEAARPMQARGLAEIIARLCEKANVPNYGPHAIRHSVGHAYADAGVPVTVTQHKLGHASPQITLEYYYPHDDARVRDASHRLPLAPLTKRGKTQRPGKIVDIQHFRKTP